MPHPIQGPAPTIEQFAQLAEKTTEKGSIVFKHGTLVSRGKTGTIFSRHSSRRAAMDALLKSITNTYGKDVADIVSGKLTELRSKGKPLRAAVVRDMINGAHAARDIRFFHHLNNEAVQNACQSFAEKNRLNEAQQQELHAVLKTEMSLRPRLFPGAESNLRLEDIARQVEEGLPCMKAMAQMLKPGKALAIPYTFYEPTLADRADIAWLQAFVPQKAADCASSPDGDLCYILQRMPAMRGAQPEGPLSLDTVWNACFGEKPPKNLHLQSPDLPKAWSQSLKALVTNKLAEHNARSPGNDFTVFLGIVGGLKLDVAVARTVQQAPVTLKDMCRQPTLLHFNPDFSNPQSVEADVAIDIHRLDLRNMPPDYSPAFTFTTHDGAVTTIHPMSEQGLSPEGKEQWKIGKPSQRSREVMKAAADLCAPNAHAQKLVVAMCFNQSALHMTKLLNKFTGLDFNEHTAHDISARADADGNVHVHYKTPENWHSHHEMTVLIRPDGSNHVTQFDLGPNPPEPEDAGVDESTVISTDFYGESSVESTKTDETSEMNVPGRTVKSENEL